MHVVTCLARVTIATSGGIINEYLPVSPQAKQTVYHIIASIFYNAKDIAEELLDLDCPLDAPDEDVRHVNVAANL